MPNGRAVQPDHEGSVPVQHFSKGSLPDAEYRFYRKQYDTPAIRVEGTFHCLTSEGNIASCTDGWLAVDSCGHPYPVNDEEFRRTYKPVNPSSDQ